MSEKEKPHIPREDYCRLPYVECDGICVGITDDEKNIYEWGEISVCENFLTTEFSFLGEAFPPTKVQWRHTPLKNPPEIDLEIKHECKGCGQCEEE